MRMKKPSLLLVPLLALLSACKAGPNYMRPSTLVPEGYKENVGWMPASPQQAAGWENWWAIYDDPVLDQLEKDVDVSNQNLRAAEAAFRAARAEVAVQRSAIFPTISASASARALGGGSSGTAGGGGSSTHTAYQATLNGTWDADLWGRIRRTVESSAATAQASSADIAAARLSAQSELATDYFALRATDEQARLFQQSIEDYQMALTIARNRYQAGVATLADVSAAETQLDNAETQLVTLRLSRARLEHAIATLTGRPATELSIDMATIASTVPVVPAGVPSALLQRRPDVAASEYNVAAANAQIGVAISAWFPDLTLTGSVGSAGTTLGRLFNVSNLAWSVGPALAETIFSGGMREAQTEQARARYDQSVATYRETVLTALQQVEDNLAALKVLEEAAAAQERTVMAARQSETLTLNQYRAGTADFTAVIQAQTIRFNAENAALGILNQRLAASVGLVVALGGGWDTTRVPQPESLYRVTEDAAISPSQSDSPQR
jgi:NodT family efflux transporter outer membrane factor (OMF) lipoprotein